LKAEFGKTLKHYRKKVKSFNAAKVSADAISKWSEPKNETVS